MISLSISLATQAALVTGYELESTVSSSQSGVPVTMGQVFKPGDVPAGSGLVFRNAAGTLLDSQIDEKAFHAD